MGPLSITLVAIAAVGLFYVIVPVALEAYYRFRDRRIVRCPETGLAAEVQVDAWHAAATAVPGPVRVHLTGCSLWPGHEGCAQGCVAAR